MKNKILSFIYILFWILLIIYIFIYLFFKNSVFIIIGQLIKYGYVDWETKISACRGRGHCSTMKTLRDVFIEGIVLLITIILICIVNSILNKIERKKDINNDINK